MDHTSTLAILMKAAELKAKALTSVVDEESELDKVREQLELSATANMDTKCLFKADPTSEAYAENEERYVFGAVMVPDLVDTQGAITSAAEVRSAAYAYMETYAGVVKLMHRGSPLRGRAVVLESYVAQEQSVFYDEVGSPIVYPPGTWFMGMRINDDDLWLKVKAGELTGFSIGAFARVTPVDGADSESAV